MLKSYSYKIPFDNKAHRICSVISVNNLMHSFESPAVNAVVGITSIELTTSFNKNEHALIFIALE